MGVTNLRRRSSGFTLVEVLIAVTILVIIALVAFYGVSSTGKALSLQRLTQSQTSSIEDTIDRMFASANTSESIFLPMSCGGTGAADGVLCPEIRFYGKDSSGNPHFWAWSYNQAAQSLTEYRNLPSADAALSAGQQVVSLADVTSFDAISENGTYWAESLGLNNVTTQEPHVIGSALDPNGRVVGGNRTMTVSLSTSTGATRTAVLMSHDATFSEDVVNYQIETPNVAPSLVCNSPSCDLNFANSVAPPQMATFTDSNFGEYLPYIGTSPPWNVSSCTNAYGVTVATVGLTSNSGDSFSATVDPKAFGTCTFTVTNFAGVSVTETVSVGGSAGDSLSLNPGATTLPVNATQTGTFAEAGPITTGNYASFPYGAGSQGANTTCDPQYVGTTISGSTFGITTVGKTPVSAVTNCQIVYYDTAYNPSNPYTSNLIYVEQVTLIPPVATPAPATAAPVTAAPTAVPTSGFAPSNPVPTPAAPFVPTLPPVPLPTPTSVPTPMIASCGSLNSYGNPTASFIPPPYDAGSPMSSLYAAVSAPSENAEYDESREPNGNVVYGYFDDWNGVHPSKTDGTKGAFLMSENDDCSVTVIVTSESIHEYIQHITFSLEFRNVYNGYPVDAIDEVGGANQGYCVFSYQDAFTGFVDSAASGCDTPAVGYQVADQHPPALTGFVPRISDFVLVPLQNGRTGPAGYGEVGASRVVFYPSSLLSIIPVPDFFHNVDRAGSAANGGGNYVYNDGSGEYATAISAIHANALNATANGLYRSPGYLMANFPVPTPPPSAPAPAPPVQQGSPYPVPSVKGIPCGRYVIDGICSPTL